MALTSGSRLGPYEIVTLVGTGGMGEVYRARDPRLGRDVAIKVLPAVVRADADRLRRFEQEARAAAALNHPNIAAILSTQDEREQRRFKVASLRLRRLTLLVQISRALGVPQPTVSRDLAWVRANRLEVYGPTPRLDAAEVIGDSVALYGGSTDRKFTAVPGGPFVQ
jgi:hypothetical protein